MSQKRINNNHTGESTLEVDLLEWNPEISKDNEWEIQSKNEVEGEVKEMEENST